MLVHDSALRNIILGKKKVALITVITSEPGYYSVSNGFSTVYESLKDRDNISFRSLTISNRYINDFKEFEFNGEKFYYSDVDLRNILSANPETVCISVLTSRDAYMIAALFDREKITSVFGGPGVKYLFFEEAERPYLDSIIVNELNTYFTLSDIDLILFKKSSSQFSCYFDQCFIKGNHVEASVPFGFDFCAKQSRHGRCIFCEFHKAMHGFPFTRKMAMRYTKNAEVFRYGDSSLSLMNAMSGPPLKMAYEYFVRFQELTKMNVILKSMSVFDPMFYEYLNKIGKIDEEKSRNMLLNFGIETLIDSVRAFINKDYVSSEQALKYITDTLKLTCVKLSANFILNIRPITFAEFEEFKKNLLYLIDKLNKDGTLDRFSFVINPDCDYFDLETVKRIEREYHAKYYRVRMNQYRIERNKYVLKLFELFKVLKKHGINVTGSVDIEEM